MLAQEVNCATEIKHISKMDSTNMNWKNNKINTNQLIGSNSSEIPEVNNSVEEDTSKNITMVQQEVNFDMAIEDMCTKIVQMFKNLIIQINKYIQVPMKIL